MSVIIKYTVYRENINVRNWLVNDKLFQILWNIIHPCGMKLSCDDSVGLERARVKLDRLKVLGLNEIWILSVEIVKIVVKVIKVHFFGLILQTKHNLTKEK